MFKQNRKKDYGLFNLFKKLSSTLYYGLFVIHFVVFAATLTKTTSIISSEHFNRCYCTQKI